MLKSTVYPPNQNLYLSKYIDRFDGIHHTADTRAKQEPKQMETRQQPTKSSSPPVAPDTSESNTTWFTGRATGSSQQPAARWAIHIATPKGNHQNLKFFLNWFAQRTEGVDRMHAFQLKTPTPEFIIPFLTETDLTVAVELGKGLIAGDPSIQINVQPEVLSTIPLVHPPRNEQYEPKIMHTTETTIFVRNIRSNQFECLGDIFGFYGQVNKITKTSGRTALINFCSPEDTSKALTSKVPSPHENLSLTKYIENQKKSLNQKNRASPFKSRVSDPETARMETAEASKLDIVHTESTDTEMEEIQEQEGASGMSNFNPEVKDEGVGGMESVNASSPTTQDRPTTSQLYIHSKYSQTHDRCWTIDTAFLDKKLAIVGLVCAPVDGQGNCGYNAIIKSGSLSPGFNNLKDETLDFLLTNEINIRLHFHGYGGTPLAEMDTLINRLKVSLTTPGIYTDNHCLQLVAWQLQQDICIHDVYDFHELVIQGKLPWQAETVPVLGPPIHIAYRRHATFSYYDQDYKPIGKLEGHYWGIILLQENLSTEIIRNHNYFQTLVDLTLDTCEISGNNQKSALHRL
jgi:hypothetical protein